MIENSDGLPPRERRLAYLSLAVGSFMAVLDITIANTALPRIASDLHASPTAAVWVVNAFQLAVTASILPFAAIGQLRGPAKIYRIGIILFTVASCLCAISHTLVALAAARVLQGLGAAAIMSITPAIMRNVFPRAQLGRALGINALINSSGAAAGPTIGGLVLALAPWPVLFAMNVPFGIANILLNHTLPTDKTRPGRIDIPSIVTSAVGFSCLIWAFDGIAREEPVWSFMLRFIVAFAAIGYFARRQFTLAEPMISLDLFRITAFSGAAITSFATFAAQGLAFVALPFLFQVALGHTPLVSGLLLTPWPLSMAIIAPIAGRLSDRYPVGILATSGLAVFAIGLALYATCSMSAGIPVLVLFAVISGVGFGFFQSPNNRELIGSAPVDKSSSAAGLLAMFRVGGQTLGASTVAIVFGAAGASLAVGSAAHDSVLHAVPIALGVACGFAGIGMLASARRLRGRTLLPLKT